ncbi:NAD-dependent epimerase/dehydratase family protein [Legionella spiritensis]|uniref:dTDP-D-glucose 4,6-dehydratase n=1 Tax=Legionella spiritensis TaxID=452 RepID=A0A0W0YZP0_LEGSP|nr:NAD-dependent epimerase/dehydratase family protein [Legionella spiritensis]KTD61990.1 dTDP-D-glucose 4,6-dehydratase [Legionella spiritensis]SNV34925.1 dTDP-D-glucose 4,6-dehydratase [Legionella spiritensis]VEG89678.1 dTDP-D-glucose 4,6-dehydratase [Legionella spiritensis]
MTDFSGKKILVVGGAGFVGSNLTNKLLASDAAKVIVVDNLLSADISRVAVDANLEFMHASITEDALLYNLPEDLDYVFHLATYHGNQSSIEDPLKDHENNTLTSLKLFDRISKFKSVQKVVYAGAGCTVAKKTFDDAEATVEQEDVSLYLDSPYQMSKIFGEFYGNYYFMRYNMPFVKARFQNVYGPGEILGAGQWRGNANTIWRNVTPTFVFKALHNLALPLENNGIATRDFIYVDDIVDGLIACALKGKAGGVYNIASGVETSIRDLATMINEITGNSAAIDNMPARPWDRSGKRHGDTTKSEQELGFKAGVSLPDGLMKTINWTKENMTTIKQCMAKHVRYVPEIQQYLD